MMKFYFFFSNNNGFSKLFCNFATECFKLTSKDIVSITYFNF